MSPQLFRGRTVIEAHRAALQQLGPEAVVLTTRSVSRSGLRGWFGGSDVELAATLPKPIPGLAIATGHHRNGYLLAPATAFAIEALIADGALPAVAQAFGLDRFGGPAPRTRELEYAETGKRR